MNGHGPVNILVPFEYGAQRETVCVALTVDVDLTVGLGIKGTWEFSAAVLKRHAGLGITQCTGH